MSPRRSSWFRAFAAKLRGHHRDDEFDAEVHEHMRLLAERFVAQGLSREDAAAAARRQFGNPTRLREDRRALQGLPYDRRRVGTTCATPCASSGRTGDLPPCQSSRWTRHRRRHGNLQRGEQRDAGAVSVRGRRADGVSAAALHPARGKRGTTGVQGREVLAFVEGHHVFDGVVAALWDPSCTVIAMAPNTSAAPA